MTNEPTTEIVEEITNQSTTNDIIVVLKMIVQYLESFTMDKMSRDVMSAAADRLESQEAQIKQLSEALAYANEWHKESVENATNELRELSGIAGELERFRAFHERYAEQTSKKYTDDICALTARAESAERERDELLTDFSTIERDGA